MDTMQMLGRWSASAPSGAPLLAFNAAIAAAVGVLRPLAAALGVLREWPAVTSAVTAQAQEQEQEQAKAKAQAQAQAKAQARSVAPPAREPAPIEFRQDQQPGPLLASRDPSTVVVGMGMGMDMGMDMDMDMDQLESVDAAHERVEHWRHFRSDGQPLSCWVFAHDATKARLAASTLARQACDRVVVAG